MANFNIAVEHVLGNEGGYVNDPDDPGGETKYGISKRAFPNIDISSLSIEDAKAIYRHEYWRFESVESQAVANKLLDMAVQFGLSTAVRLLQNVLHVTSDGIFGANSLRSTNAQKESVLLQELRIACAVRYCLVISRNTSLIKYVNGWMRRAIQ
jgi:lysozyme family protein